jgi:hypothetical protein
VTARIRVGSQVFRSAPKPYACKNLRGAPTFRLPAALTKTLRQHRGAATGSLIINAAHQTHTLSLALNGNRAAQIRTNADTAYFWGTGYATCNDTITYQGPYVQVTPPNVDPGYTLGNDDYVWFYWRSGLITWDGIHNKWLPNRAGDNGSGSNWNWKQYSGFELNYGLDATGSGYQDYAMQAGAGLYTYAWVQTYYWFNGAWHGGQSKWIQNEGSLLTHSLVGGYCYWG